MGYITITCHYIDSSWSLHSVILTTTNMQKDHTAETIADELKAATDEWGIIQKIVAVVTDNAANIVAAIRLNGWKHVPCFAHILNLIVQDALKDDLVLSDTVRVEIFEVHEFSWISWCTPYPRILIHNK